jgi:hypothetical protein
MKAVARYIENENTTLDGSYLSTLINPNQVFVNGVIAYEPAENIDSGLLVDTTLPIVSVFTSTRGSTPTTVILTIITAYDNDVVQTIYILVSSTQMTMHTSMEIKVAGIQVPGNSLSYNVTWLSANTTYYGWAMADDVSRNESVVVASTPAFLKWIRE